jgi:hypothetical protein
MGQKEEDVIEETIIDIKLLALELSQTAQKLESQLEKLKKRPNG